MIADRDRAMLLRLAREAIEAFVGAGAAHVPSDAPILTTRAGVFVSLHQGGELRGCVGHVEADETIGTLVPRCAVAAASADPRFPPIAPDEVRRIEIEISLLGRLVPIAGPADVVVGRDGLMVQRGALRGLLLPQVAVEWQWDPETFLAHACAKAGLPRDAWKSGLQMWRFEADVFAEPESARRG